jgi:hypothetical protein
MTMRRAALAVVLAVFVVNATDAGAMDGYETMAGYAFGKSYVITIRGEDLKKSPAWDQAAENPPLSARRALKLATEHQRALIPAPADWIWQLQYIGLRETQGKWYWLAHFEASQREAFGIGPPPDLYVAVLMDGTVVKPVVRDHRADAP